MTNENHAKSYAKSYEINLVSTAVSLLEQHVKIHRLSSVVTISLILLLIYFSMIQNLSLYWLYSLTLVIILGVMEIYYAMRLAFDISLLDKLQTAQSNLRDDLSELDQALITLKLLPAAKSGRDINDRITGCFRLFKTQIALCVLQFMIVLVSFYPEIVAFILPPF